MATQQLLLLLRRERLLSLTPLPRCPQLTRAPTPALRARPGLGCRGHLGHEVEVEELDELELDLAGCGAGLEEGGDGEETVEGLEGAGVAWGVDEGGYEGEEGGGLDCGTVDGLEEVEEELWTCQYFRLAMRLWG